ncbi:MAG: RNA polymerase sigma factor [Candidatus Dormibacteria bacterium]
MTVTLASGYRGGAQGTGLDPEAIYLAHYGAVMRYVRARVASSELAEDLVSDVFCRAVAKADTYRTLRETALPWLYRIAANRVADHYRRQRLTCSLEVAGEVPDPALGPMDIVTRRETIRTVWRLSQGLSPAQRTALWLRYGEDLELKDIAARMGRSVAAVKVLIHRALRRLGALLDVQPPSRSTIRGACALTDRGGRE